MAGLSMAVIPLRAQAQPKKRPQPKKRSRAVFRQKLLADLRRQSEIALKTHNGEVSEDIRTLAHLALCAGPRSRSVQFQGIWFPLYTGFVTRQIRCPDTGVPLVGVVT